MGFLSTAAAGLAVLAALPSRVAADKPYHLHREGYQDGDMGEKPTQKFKSSKLVAPVYQINKWDPSKVDTDSPYLFMAGNYGQWGPSIVRSDDLSLVWADQNYGGVAQATREWPDWNGKRVMSSYSDGRVRVYDESYEQLYVYDGQGDLSGRVPDSHEATLTHDGHILFFVCPPVKADLTKVNGPKDGELLDCTVQEIEPESHKVLFQWATSDYFKPEDATWKYGGGEPWDHNHMNAVEKTEEGNFLISFRHLSAIVLVNGKTNEMIWVMGGKKNMFKDISTDGKTAEFAFQHEARMTGKNRFTLFDNHRAAKNGFCEKRGGPCSRGLEVEYDPVKMTVWVVNEWWHPQSLISASRGGTQRTPKGNVLVAWGQNPMYTEYDKDGEVVMDVQRGQVLEIEHGIFDIVTYRVWKGNWVGKPKDPPSIACDADDTGRAIYVSWNGATEVTDWVLLMAHNKTELDGADKVAAQSPRNGFETTFKLDSYLPWARIAALDRYGKIIGSTQAVNTKNKKTAKLDYDVTEVTRPGTKSLDSKIPSSAAVTIPTIGFEGADDEKVASDEGDSKMPKVSKTTAGSALGGLVICVVGVVGLVFYLRRRRIQKRGSPSGNAEASYGLLPRDGIDDEGRTGRYDHDKDMEQDVRSMGSGSRSR